MAQDRPPQPPPPGGQGPPPQAYEDCRGKKAGDAVQHTTPEGTVAATCVDSPQGLVARPNQPPDSGPTTDASLEAAAQDAETAFRAFMEAWAYEQHWRMWEMGTEASRRDIGQNEFADRLRASKIKPAAGEQVEALEADPHSERYVELDVRFSLENAWDATSHSFSGTIAAQKEGPEWKFNLRDFLRLLTNW
jgi:hypothetical protein